jgi:N-acetylmuramoyl-L-alanine amidase
MIFALLISLLSNPAQAAVPAGAPFRVVIDPGHGGTDEGTVYNAGALRVAEKQITLMLAQEAAQQLRARGFHVSLTRQADVEVSVPERTKLANRLGADVFVSIHMNSAAHLDEKKAKNAQGIETYILNNATDASSHRLAELENSVLNVRAASPELTDVALILKDLRLDANLASSKKLACVVQQNLVSLTSKKKDRGVKQALFHVLLGADMPSILVEAGFLSHPKDREFVSSSAGRRAIGVALAEAIEKYKDTKSNRVATARLGSCKVH